MKQKFSPLLLFILITVLALTGCARAAAQDKTGQVEPQVQEQPVEVAAIAPPEARTLTAYVGAGQDTTTINAFLPSTLRVRVGDTVTWKLDADEIHTVTFLGGQPQPMLIGPAPGGSPEEAMLTPEAAFPTRLPGAPVETYDGTNYVNSGIMSKAPAGPDAPPNDTFSLTFEKPGLYSFLCLVHPFMQGVVVVEPATGADVPSQADIDAQAKAEREPLLAQVEAVNAAGQTPRSQPGPDGSQLWFVDAGSNMIGDPRPTSLEFLAKELTINAGDTVVWTSHEFHTITFDPVPPAPEFIVPVPQQDGPPFLTLNAEVATPAKPNQIYDPADYYNSGFLSPGTPGGDTWSLTFEKPGTYKYFCAVHRYLGMEGTIVVK